MSLKVIGGQWRGRNLHSVRGIGTRPLLGQVREALFNILQDRLEDAEFWDLFAGTGASGIEALSRGARRVIFVEKANKVLSVLRENLALFGEEAADRAVVVRADAWEPPLLTPDDEDDEGERAPDIVFLDPPYAMVAEDPARSVYRALGIYERLAPDGILCFHFQDGVLQEDDFDPGLDVDLRVWGRSAVAIIHKPADD